MATYAKTEFVNQDNYKIYDGITPALSAVGLEPFTNATMAGLIAAIAVFKAANPSYRAVSLNTFFNPTANAYEALLAYAS